MHAAQTDTGRVRVRNEDAYLVRTDLGVVGVADGMGGHPHGDLASRTALAGAASFLEYALGSHSGPRDAPTLAAVMASAVLAGHAAIREAVRSDPSLEGMGTTLVLAHLAGADPAEQEDRREAHGAASATVAHVGDSRAYRVEPGGLRRLTRDDTWVQQQVELGRLSPEEAEHHPEAHILSQCLGLERPPEPHVGSHRLEPGACLLLCTDGLSGMLSDPEMAEVLAGVLGRRGHPASLEEATIPSAGQLDAAARALVRAALEAGGHDNVTVVLATWADGGGGAVARSLSE